MNKPVLGLLLGAVLGAFDGLSALISAPEVAPQITEIVFFSTIKGLLAGVLIGWVATRKQSMSWGLVSGLLISGFFAFLVAAMPTPDGTHYWWQIMLPGCVLGMIVGYATQRYGRAPVTS